MYSYEDRIRAVKFYINCGYNAAYTVSKLGYPDASNLKHWYREYSESNDLHQGRKKVSKYSDKEKRDAVDYYLAKKSNYDSKWVNKNLKCQLQVFILQQFLIFFAFFDFVSCH